MTQMKIWMGRIVMWCLVVLIICITIASSISLFIAIVPNLSEDRPENYDIQLRDKYLLQCLTLVKETSPETLKKEPVITFYNCDKQARSMAKNFMKEGE